MPDSSGPTDVRSAPAARPLLSVVIPARNEEAFLGQCLSALAAQDLDAPFEVIVVDNGSRDATAAVAARHGARVVSEPRAGAANARRAGFLAARADLLVSTDADCVPPPEWLSRVVAAFETDPQLAGLIGGIAYTSERRLVAVVLRWLMAAALFIDRCSGGHPSEANFAVARTAYDAVGGSGRGRARAWTSAAGSAVRASSSGSTTG